MPGSTKIRPTNDAIPPPCCEQSRPWSDGEHPQNGHDGPLVWVPSLALANDGRADRAVI